MKKMTVLILTVLTLGLTACGNNEENKAELTELENKVTSLQEELAERDETIEHLIETLESSKEQRQELIDTNERIRKVMEEATEVMEEKNSLIRELQERVQELESREPEVSTITETETIIQTEYIEIPVYMDETITTEYNTEYINDADVNLTIGGVYHGGSMFEADNGLWYEFHEATEENFEEGTRMTVKITDNLVTDIL